MTYSIKYQRKWMCPRELWKEKTRRHCLHSESMKLCHEGQSHVSIFNKQLVSTWFLEQGGKGRQINFKADNTSLWGAQRSISAVTYALSSNYAELPQFDLCFQNPHFQTWGLHVLESVLKAWLCPQTEYTEVWVLLSC